MAILPSELCRLVLGELSLVLVIYWRMFVTTSWTDLSLFCLSLGFLEEEKLANTFRSLLFECPYLKECRVCFEKGIQFPKTVHGKTLIDYVNKSCKDNKTICISQ